MSTDPFIHQIKNSPEETEFDQVIEYIQTHFHYTPGRFYNGLNEDKFVNEAGSNEGSCKIFNFAKLH